MLSEMQHWWGFKKQPGDSRLWRCVKRWRRKKNLHLPLPFRQSHQVMAKLMASKQCLDLLKLNHSSSVLIEVNSEISINVLKKISYGTVPEGVSKQWRLIQVYQRIHKHLQCLWTVSFNHVRRRANKVADLLANQGVINSECRIKMKWQEMPPSRLKAICEAQAIEDKEIYDYWARRAGND